MRERFRGEICGFGTTSGRRVVIGRWPSSPFGAFADVMVEAPDGERTLLAPDPAIAEFVSQTYRFDSVEIVPVVVERTLTSLTCRAGAIDVELSVGRRTLIGTALRVLPERWATSPVWCSMIDPVARVVMRGVRTRGSAGNGRREWYGATDQRRIDAVIGTWSGGDLGALADVWPPVRFGFSSTPRRPSVVATTTTVEM